jgi:LAO/AO transport system kinase
VIGVSALKKEGMVEFWAEIERFRSVMTQSGELEEKRKKQALNWMWSLIESGLHYLFRSHPAIHAALPELTRDVAEGATTPGAAAKRLLAYLKV